MKVIHMLFVIGVSINPVIAGDYEDGKGSIEKGNNLDILKSFPRAVKNGYFKSQFYLSFISDESTEAGTDKTAEAIWFLKAAEHSYQDAQ